MAISTIKNYMDATITTGRGTLNSSYFSGGNVRYWVIGHIVIVNISDVVVSVSVPGTVVPNIITGLPPAHTGGLAFLFQQFGTDASWRVVLNTDGSIQSHYDGQSTGGSQWYANFTYVTN